MTPAIRTVYWDASIFLALLFFENCTYDTAINMMRRLYATNTALAISRPLEIEVADAIRRRVTRHAKSATSAIDADRTISRTTERFHSMLKMLEADGKLTRIDIAEPASTYHEKILDILLNHPGHTVADLAGRLRHLGAGYRDIEHAYHAAIARIDVFYTLDAGFKSIFGDPIFAKVCFVILGRAKPNSGSNDGSSE